MPDGSGRRAEIVASLGSVRARIAAACEAAGRGTHEITLVAVTKTRPAADVVTLAALGVRDVGENRDQEARAKRDDVLGLRPGGDPIRWHFVGRLQSRKCRSVAGYAHAVHSLDRAELVGRLADGVDAAGRPPLEIFVQVSLDDDPSRAGVPVGEVAALADAVAANARLVLRGVMAVAPIDADPDAAFAVLRTVSDDLHARHPGSSAISAGMSGDLEAAIRNGATHVRVGSALLGRRAVSFS